MRVRSVLVCLIGIWFGSHGAGVCNAERIIFVDDTAPAGGNGASWETAFQSLQDALFDVQRAPRACEIRVAQGVYKPDVGARENLGDRDASFDLQHDLAVRGGFAGFGAAAPDERDVRQSVTVLSGDLAGDDEPDFQNIEENSRHVVTGAYGSDSILDGFTVTGGNADDDWGGGLNGGSAAVTHCIFEGNRATRYGGAAQCFARFSDCTFRGNESELQAGAVYAGGGTITDCLFVDNHAVLGGAGGGASDGVLTWEGCTFEGNSAEYGGALWFGDYGGYTTIDGCVFQDNDASADGGAVFIGDEFRPTILNSIFVRNSAGGVGGGLYSRARDESLVDLLFRDNTATLGGGYFRRDGAGGDSATLRRCILETNSALLGGGAYIENAHVIMDDCALVRNSAVASGGGVYNDSGLLTVTGGTIGQNDAALDGGGVFSFGDVEFAGTRILGNSASDGGGLHVAAGSATVNASFIDSNTAVRGGGIYGLLSTLTLTETDLTRNTASEGGGVYARDGAVYLVVCDLSGNEGFEGGGVAVVEGELSMLRCRVDENIAMYSGAGVAATRSDVAITDSVFEANDAVFGGAGLKTLDGCRTVVTRSLFLANTAQAAAGISDQANESLRVFDSSFIDNETLFGGTGISTRNGLVVEIRGSTFIRNVALNDGANGAVDISAFSVESEELTVADCLFEDNLATNYGGALAIRGNHAQVLSSEFRRNTSRHGGALRARTETMEVIDCSFLDNTSIRDGGAIDAAPGVTLSLVNCLIAGNAAEEDGGALDFYGDRLVVANCTIVGNAAETGGGLNLINGTDMLVSNSIVRGNAGGEIAQGESPPDVVFSNVEGSFPGVGNIDADPVFLDAPAGDYRLATGSPCIDAADSDAVPAGIEQDLTGYDRFVDDPETKDTGAGAPPIVDMGAYEFQAGMCEADVTDDGLVGFADVLTLLALWGPCEGCPEDIDGSGDIGFGDVLAVLAAWGPCP